MRYDYYSFARASDTRRSSSNMIGRFHINYGTGRGLLAELFGVIKKHRLLSLANQPGFRCVVIVKTYLVIFNEYKTLFSTREYGGVLGTLIVINLF